MRGALSVVPTDAFEEEGADEDGDFELDGDGEGDLEVELPDFAPPPPTLPPTPFNSFIEFKKISCFSLS